MWGVWGSDVMIPAITKISQMHSDVQFVVYWSDARIQELLWQLDNIDVVTTQWDITDDVKFETEKDLLRWIANWKQSSIVQWVKSVKQWVIDIMVSRGNTWVYVWYAKNALKQDGSFAALSCWIPRTDMSNLRYTPWDALLMDVWAEIDTTTQKLVNNARLWIQYIQSTLGIEKPKFTLLNIWSEPYKWDKAYRDWYKEFVEDDFWWEFLWNQESDSLLVNVEPDLIVAGWMVWNIALKSMEGTFLSTLELIRRKAYRNPIEKWLGLYTWFQMKKGLWRFNPNNRPDWKLHWISSNTWWEIYKAHGWADVTGVINAIDRAIKNRKKKEEA